MLNFESIINQYYFYISHLYLHNIVTEHEYMSDLPDTVYGSYVSDLYASMNNKTFNKKSNGCTAEKDIELDVYQKFVSNYLFRIQPKSIHGLLLFHNTGSGKTCTSIDILSEYFKRFPSQTRAYVVLPTPKDAHSYAVQLRDKCPSVRRTYRGKMNLNGVKNMQRDYITVDLETLSNAHQHRVIILDMKTYARARVRGTASVPGVSKNENIFENTLVIVDEADVLLRCVNKTHKEDYLTLNYVTPPEYIMNPSHSHPKLNILQTILKDMQSIPKPQKVQAKLINYNNSDATMFPNTRKLVLMTATPYVDKFYDIFPLLKTIKPNAKEWGLFEGTISYVDNRTDYSLYPRVYEQDVNVQLHPNHEKKLKKYFSTLAKSTRNNMEKSITIECGGTKCKSALSSVKLEDVPKIAKMLDIMQQAPKGSKHLIYVHENLAGSRVVEYMIKQHSDFQKVAVVTSQKPNMTVLQKFNHPDNKHGEHIHVLIIQGKAFVRATTFKAVRYLHILTPLIDMNEHDQLIGRVARRCSHDSLSKKDWDVKVFSYSFETNDRRSANERGISKRMAKKTVIDNLKASAKYMSVDRDLSKYVNKSKKHGSLLNFHTSNEQLPVYVDNRKGIPPKKSSNDNYLRTTPMNS